MNFEEITNRELFCHNCCDIVNAAHGTCPYCNGYQLEAVSNPESLQRRTEVYVSPPNVTEPHRPLILVGNQVVRPGDLPRRRNPTLDTSRLNKQAAVSSLSAQTDCSICLIPLRFSDRIAITSDDEPDEISKLECGHIFHYECAKRWFQSTAKNECPFCRQKAIDM